MKQQSRKKKKAPTKKPKTSLPVVPPRGDPPAPETHADETSAEQQAPEQPILRPSKLDTWTCRATVAIAIATFLYTLFAGWQLLILKGQLSQMRQDSQSNSAAAQKQLDIMQGQLTHIQEASHLEQRAWVGFTKATHKPIEPNKPVQGEFVFRNTGRTPAVIITSGRSTFIRPPEFNVASIADIKRDEAWMEDQRSQGPLPPNASVTLPYSISRDLPMSKELVQSINDGKLCVYVVGRIVYKDIFDIEHESRFCGILDPDTDDVIQGHIYNYMD